MKPIFQREQVFQPVLFGKHWHNLTPIRHGKGFAGNLVQHSLFREGKEGEDQRGKGMDCRKRKSELGLGLKFNSGLQGTCCFWS